MKKTQMIFAMFALAAIAIGGVAYWAGVRNASRISTPSPTPPHISDELNAELDRIQTAEKIDDPYQRCIAYPNPLEFDWSPEQIDAMCKLLTRRMMVWKDIQQALDEHHPERLQAAFDEYLARNDAGEHGFLTWAYWWMFQSSSKWADDVTNQWLQADPDSAYALAARGIHYSEKAWDARGSDTVSNTPTENFKRMTEYVAKSRADLQRSLQRNPRLIAAYYGLLRTSQLSEDPDETTHRDAWIQQALALDPADGWIYQEWMNAEQPQWGGSTERMEHVAEMAAQHADANPLLALLKAEPICNEADRYRCDGCDKDGDKSLALYRKAGAIGPASCFLGGAGAAAVLAQDLATATRYYSQAYRFLGRDEWLAYRAQNLRSLGRGAWALENLQNANVRDPRSTTVLHALALAYADAGRIGDVEQAYRRMLEIDPNNNIAAIDLSKLYIGELKSAERARPLIDALLAREPNHSAGWYVRTMLCESANDMPCYRAAAAKFLHYANHHDPWQSANISVVQSKLAQIGPGDADTTH